MPRIAVDDSVVADEEFIPKLGLEPPNHHNYIPDSDSHLYRSSVDSARVLRSIVQRGAAIEDSALPPRSSNHFYDIQTGGRSLSTLTTPGMPLNIWIQESQGPIENWILASDQDYSILDS